MYQRSTERNSSYLGRSWIRLGASASSSELFLYTKKSAEVIVLRGNEPFEPMEDSQIKEGLNDKSGLIRVRIEI